MANGWGALKTQEGEEGAKKTKPLFTSADIAKVVEQNKNSVVKSNICAVFYGLDGTGKSGAAIDCRTPEEIKEGLKIYVMDFDDGCAPLKYKYYDNDENLILLDPTYIGEDNKPDYVATYDKSLAIIKYILEQEEAGVKIKAVVLDGLDSLLKICEYVMKIEDLKINPQAQITQSFEWGKRNSKYYTILLLLKRLKCHKFYITHMKDLKKWTIVPGSGDRELSTIGTKPNWQDQTPNMMFQKVLFTREDSNGKVVLKARIEKCKTNISLEGKEVTIAEISKDKSQWNGLKDLINQM